MKPPTSAWAGTSAYAMAEQRAERWQMRYEETLEQLVEANDLLAELGEAS